MTTKLPSVVNWAWTSEDWNPFSGNLTKAKGSGINRSGDPSFVGSVNPRWRSQVSHHENATTTAFGTGFHGEDGAAFTMNVSTQYAIGVFRDVGYNRTSGTRSCPFPDIGSNAVDPTVKSDVRNRAIRKFLDQAKSKRSSFEAGQDLGEIKETIESFIHPMKSLRNLTVQYFSKLKKAKRRYRGDNNSLRRALSDSYLEYRFGWRPLALDLADAYEGLRNRSRMTNIVDISASASSGPSNGNPPVAYGAQVTSSYITFTRSTQGRYTYKIKGAILLDLTPEGTIPVMQALQLDSLNDFATTAWDLLPFSFVVDYFTNVGDIVNSLTFPYSKLAWNCATEREIVTWTYYASPNIPPPSGGVTTILESFSAANPSRSYVRFSRTALDYSDWIPVVRFSLPVSSRPWVNMANLISANIKSLVPFHR